MLTALRMELGRIDRLRAAGDTRVAAAVTECRQLVDDMVHIVRDLALGLRPSMLDDFGLQPALEWLARDFTRRSNVPVELHVFGALDALGEQHRTCIYRVVQEALTNCVRHARATAIRVHVRASRRLHRGLGGRRRRRARSAASRRRFRPARHRGTRARAGRHDFAGEQRRPGRHACDSSASDRGACHLRVLLADDHSIVRRGLRSLIESEPDIKVVAEASEGLEALKLCDEHQPDAIILDVAMPKMNGIEVAERVQKLARPPSVLILSMHADESYIIRALAAGARAYLLKDATDEDLIPALRAVAAGRPFFSPSVTGVLIEDYVRQLQARGLTDSYHLLTDREREVLQLLAEGRSNKEVAALLDLGVSTVETHRANLMQKLNLHNTAEIVLYAVRKRIIV